MSGEKDTAAKIETLSTIVVNLGTIVSWILTVFTAFVLTSQPQPISLPGFFELNSSYKLLFFLSVLLGYIQLLKKQWENQKRSGKNIEGSFGCYLFGSIIKFKRPLVFIGFLIILNLIGTIIFTEMIGLGIIITIIGIIAMLIFLQIGDDAWVATKLQFDDEFRKKWLKRIKNQLYEYGYTHTINFANLPVKQDEINWAIKMYFNHYEFEQDLIFTQKFFKDYTYKVCEIRFKHVPSFIDELTL